MNTEIYYNIIDVRIEDKVEDKVAFLFLSLIEILLVSKCVLLPFGRKSFGFDKVGEMNFAETF